MEQLLWAFIAIGTCTIFVTRTLALYDSQRWVKRMIWAGHVLVAAAWFSILATGEPTPSASSYLPFGEADS